jgi:hypothetical protein
MIVYLQKMLHHRAETKGFFIMLAFLSFYCMYLFVFRRVLIDVEESYGVNLFKPEPAQAFVIILLVLLYHFCFVGLYYFSQGDQWLKFAAVVIGMAVAGGLLYGFSEWYRVTSEPFFQFGIPGNLPWYAREKEKFLITNIPLVLFILYIFAFRIVMIFRTKDSSKS